MSSVITTPSSVALSTKVGAHTPANERRRPRRGKEKPVSPGAECMRLYRDRRHHGLRCVTIEIRLTEIQELALRGLLSSASGVDPDAVTDALHRFLDESLRSTERRVTSRAG